ncbi:hypothetical protein QUA41_28075 [Microcoleus sp. Pol11C1]|uniref:hypothetical protein n=2 Tax=unclassified Microcoleus TaxID=2642155 RepID=UPI002FCF8691
MSTKKRKPLGSAMEEFVFGTKEKEAASPTPPEIVSPAATPTASPPPPEIVSPVATPPQPEVSAPETVSIQSKEPSLMSKLQAPDKEATSIQSKEPSLMSKLQAPDKEATVRFTVDMSETLHRKLSMLAARTGRKKVDIVRMLLEDGLKEVEG